METRSRLPALSEPTFDGALLWFAQLQAADMLFNPEDDPASDLECSEIRSILEKLESTIGHEQVVDAAYPIFMNAMGIMLDS